MPSQLPLTVSQSSARALRADLSRLRAAVAEEGAAIVASWAPALRRPAFEPGAAHLAHYLALDLAIDPRNLPRLIVAAGARQPVAVMIARGPHQVEAIAFLDDVLHRMDRHQHKKTARLAPLGSWTEPQTL